MHPVRIPQGQYTPCQTYLATTPSSHCRRTYEPVHIIVYGTGMHQEGGVYTDSTLAAGVFDDF